MKQFFILASAVLLLFCISCNQPSTSPATDDSGGNNDAAQKNLDVCNAVNKAIQTGDVSPLDTLLTEDAVDHSGENGDVKGRDSIKAELARYHSMSSDMKMETIKELADDEYVFQWIRFTGTGNGMMGMPKGPYDMTSIEVTKFTNGKASEHWEFMQPAEMMKMMSAQHMPGPPSKDATHK